MCVCVGGGGPQAHWSIWTDLILRIILISERLETKTNQNRQVKYFKAAKAHCHSLTWRLYSRMKMSPSQILSHYTKTVKYIKPRALHK